MAIRKKNALGITSGKLGNTVTRIRNGKEVVYNLPDKVNISQSKNAKASRNKFALTVRFSKSINSIPALSCVWKSAKVPGTSSFQKLIKYNSKFTSVNNLTIKNVITPKGFEFNVEEIIYSGDEIQILISSINTRTFNNNTFTPVIYSVLYFFEPKRTKFKPFSFSSLSNDMGEILTMTKIDIHFTLSKTQKSLFGNYNKCILYFAIILSPESSNNPVWSSSASNILDLAQNI